MADDVPRVVRPARRAAPPRVLSPNGLPRPTWTAWVEKSKKGHDRWRVAAFGSTFAEALAAAQAKGYSVDVLVIRRYLAGPSLPTSGSKAAL